MITQAFDLNMIPSSAPVVVHVDQYDHGEGRFIISLYNGDIPYSPTGTAIIQGTKPDGKGFEYSATLSGNTVTASLTEQMTAVYGIVRAQIVITETSGRTGTFVFNLDVQKSALPADADMSHSEYQIVEELLEDVQQAAADAAQSAENADASAEDSEAWAVGTRDGVPVTSDDPTYHNSSKWWAEHGGGGGGSAHTIVNAKGQDMTNRAALKFANMRVTDDAAHNQTVVESGSVITITTTESTLYSQNVTLSDGTTTLSETFSNSGVAVFYGVSLTGNLSISSSDGVDTAIGSITVPYFGIYEKDISFWSATIAVTTTTADFDGLTVYAKKNGVTKGSAVFSSGSANITVPETGSYTLEVTQDWHTYTSQAITVSAQTTYNASIDGFEAPISLSTPTTDFYSQNIAVSLDGNPITTSLAFDNTGAASFDALVAGTYVFTLTYQGEPYTATVVVTTETSYSGVIKMWTATIKVTASSQLYSQSVTVYKGSTSVGTVTLDATGKADILVHEAGTYYVKGVYDGWTYSTDAISVSAETDYPVTLEVFICTLSISTTSTELYSQTITVTKGGSTVGTTAFSAGGSATFRVHETGTYTLTCTYGGEDYSESITIVSGDDGTTKTVTIDTLITYNLTVKIYSAAADTVTFTDDNGAKTAVTAGQSGALSPGESTDVNITITQPSVGVDPTITFTSYVAKDPANLSNAYTKDITIHGNETELYIMPEGAVYWYGYDPYNMYATSAKPSGTGGYSLAPTLTKTATNSFKIAISGSQQQGSVLTTDQVDATGYSAYKLLIASVTTATGDYHGARGQVTNSNPITSGSNYNNTAAGTSISSTTSSPFIQSVSISVSGNVRVGIFVSSSMTLNVSAMWLE